MSNNVEFFYFYRWFERENNFNYDKKDLIFRLIILEK
jgi:hypothetical protein